MAKTTMKTWVVAALAVGATGFAMLAQADCLRAGHVADAGSVAEPVREPKGDVAVSMIDPAIDSMFARYADLHRDAVGYAMADLPGTSMVAGANPQNRTPITR